MEINEDKLILGEKQYTQDELNQLVEFGNKYQDFKSKYDTDPEKAWSAYGKMSNEVTGLREKAKEAETLRAEIEELKKNPSNVNQSGELTAEAKREAKEAARKLDILTKDDIDDILKERGYVKKDDIDNAFTSRKIISEFDELSKKYNGSDGLPKFDQDEMVAYMERTRISDPEMAYRMKFSKEVDEYNAQKLLEAKYPQLVTSKAGAEDKKPKKDPVTRDNMADKLKAVMFPDSF